MRRNFRAFALAAAAGLLLVAPSATAFATTPIPFPHHVLTESVPLSAQMLAFRQHNVSKSIADAFRDVSHPVIDTSATTTIDISSRYDGKRLPI